jgi:dihydrofolate synthase/folylpolyglutamate synthase
LTTPDTERAVMPEDLKTLADDYCSQTEVIAKPADALRRAQTLAAPDDLICAAGSLYLVGDIKGVLAGTPVHHQ